MLNNCGKNDCRWEAHGFPSFFLTRKPVKRPSLSRQSSRPPGASTVAFTGLHSHGIKPHGDRCHQKAECQDPSDERHLGEDAELRLPPGGCHGSGVLHPAAGPLADVGCLRGSLVLSVLGQQLLHLLKQLNVEQEGGLGFFEDPLLDLGGHLQSVHSGAVQLLELGGVGDIGESEEGQALPGAGQVQGLLSDLLEDLAPRQVTHVAGVGVGHQQLGLEAPHLLQSPHVALGGLRVGDGLLPAGPIPEGHVLLQGGPAVQLFREVEGRVDRVLLVVLNLLLQGIVDVVQGRHHQLKAFSGDLALLKVLHELGILSLDVHLLGGLLQGL
uniref:Heme oxygenase 1 n=1 Tax=Sus scrofa TaxID=9823 RepID=A0A480F5Z3_PIG